MLVIEDDLLHEECEI